MMQDKRTMRIARKNRIRAKITGDMNAPRLSVYRSNQFIYAQLIDDARGVTLASATDRPTKGKKVSGTKTDRAIKVGEQLAKTALDQKISKVVFDRNGYRFHGRVKALAEGARKAGLEF